MGAGWWRGFLPIWVALGILTMPATMAGTPSDAEILDPVGDHTIDWLDIERVWFEHGPDDVPHIRLQVPGRLQVPPDMGTGGMWTGPHFQVDFELYHWNGTRIGNLEQQRVIFSVEETISRFYVCIWSNEYFDPDDSVGCWSNGSGGIQYGPNGTTIRWDLDFKTRLGDAWRAGSGYRFENVSAWATFRVLYESTETDRAPDVGTAVSPSPPKSAAAIADDEQRAAGATMLARGNAHDGPIPAEPQQIALGLAVITGILAGMGRFVYKVGRFRLLQWLTATLLFSRIVGDEALGHNRRSLIFEYVRGSPGATFSRLRRELGIGSGPLVHHLCVLERTGHVRVVRTRGRTSFFPAGVPLQAEATLSDVQRELLGAVSGEPGIDQVGLVRRLDLPRKNVAYHVGRLVAGGLLATVREHGKLRHFPA